MFHKHKFYFYLCANQNKTSCSISNEMLVRIKMGHKIVLTNEDTSVELTKYQIVNTGLTFYK